MSDFRSPYPGDDPRWWVQDCPYCGGSVTSWSAASTVTVLGLHIEVAHPESGAAEGFHRSVVQ